MKNNLAAILQTAANGRGAQSAAQRPERGCTPVSNPAPRGCSHDASLSLVGRCCRAAFLFAFFAFFAVNSHAAFISFSFTNYLGQPDTNYFKVFKVGPTLADGSVIPQGLPIRITPATDGKATNWLAEGNYIATNGFIGGPYNSINFKAPADSGPTVYPFTSAGVWISGGNFFVTQIMPGGTNASLTQNQVTNALGYLPASPLSISNAIATDTNAIDAARLFGTLILPSFVGDGEGFTNLFGSNVVGAVASSVTTSNLAPNSPALTAVSNIAAHYSGGSATNVFLGPGTHVTVVTNSTGSWTVAADSQTNAAASTNWTLTQIGASNLQAHADMAATDTVARAFTLSSISATSVQAHADMAATDTLARAFTLLTGTALTNAIAASSNLAVRAAGTLATNYADDVADASTNFTRATGTALTNDIVASSNASVQAGGTIGTNAAISQSTLVTNFILFTGTALTNNIATSSNAAVRAGGTIGTNAAISQGASSSNFTLTTATGITNDLVASSNAAVQAGGTIGTNVAVTHGVSSTNYTDNTAAALTASMLGSNLLAYANTLTASNAAVVAGVAYTTALSNKVLAVTIPATNGTATSLTVISNLNYGSNYIAIRLTNAIVGVALDSPAGGTYLTSGATTWTNMNNLVWDLIYSAPHYYFRSNANAQISFDALATNSFTSINGMTVPSRTWIGVVSDNTGTLITGPVNSSNITAQIVAGEAGYVAAFAATGTVANATTATTASGLTGDQTFTNRYTIFTNTSSPQQLDLGTLLAAMPKVANQAQGFGGGNIRLSPGIYLVSTSSFAVSTPFSLEIAGSGAGNTALVFTNMNGTTPGLALASINSSAGGNCLSVDIHDLRICGTADVTNSLLSISNTAGDSLKNLIFSTWNWATNSNGEWGGAYGGQATNLIGLKISSINGQQTILDNISFSSLKVGGAIGVDHLRVINYLGIEVCGQTKGTGSWGTNVYSIGGGLFINQGMNDDVIIAPHSYRTPHPIVVNADVNQLLVVGGDWGEEGGESGCRSVSVEPFTNRAAAFLFFNNYQAFNWRDSVAHFNGTDWVVTNTAPHNIIDIYKTGTLSDLALNLALGGNVLLSLKNTNVYVANLVAANDLVTSGLTTFPIYNYNDITISGSTNAHVNGRYVYAYTNIVLGYSVLTNASGSTNGIVINDPMIFGVVLIPTNCINTGTAPLALAPVAAGIFGMNGPWTDLLSAGDDNVSGVAAVSYSAQINTNGVTANNFTGPGSGLYYPSNTWNLTSVTQSMANFSFALASSNGVPVVVAVSNGVSFVNYLSNPSGGIIP